METKQTMRAMVVTRYGSPDVLELQEREKPQPRAQEVLIKVLTSSATTADSMMRTGKPMVSRLFTGLKRPKHAIPGNGFAGIVEATGIAVQGFKPGDEVFGETTLGFSTNAEYVVVPENGVILPKPESLNFADAATFGDGPMTSYNFLVLLAGIQAGQKVLINGASGSLGSAAVQLAKHLGAEVSGVCSTRNLGLVKSLGTDFTIDYTQENFTQRDKTYDIIYDTVGNLSFGRCKKVLTAQGQFLSPVLSFSVLLQAMLTSIAGKKKVRFFATGLRKVHELREILFAILNLVQDGKLKVWIDRQYPLEKLAEAHQYIATGRKKGNVVIINPHEL